jgi:tRNA pseudouridine32 synthase / 23S rRNA pseudouridine746 synthase
MLHSLESFIQSEEPDSTPTYWYDSRLPRTRFVEAIARNLMRQLTVDEGKMYGVLLVETPAGELRILKAFSGLLSGQQEMPGWVPPIPGREQIAIVEAQTLKQLDEIKQALLQLQQIPERQEYLLLQQEFQSKLESLAVIHRQRKADRDARRENANLEQLKLESQKDGIEKRKLKQQRDQILQPLKQIIEQADAQVKTLKQRRKRLSQSLQAQMHSAYRITNFAGNSLSLEQLIQGGMPTGTGECCAPKLLHYAATHHLKAIALAEFWWGGSNRDKIQGEFYGACVDRCQPILGFLLSGLSPSLEILYEDEWLIVINKPAGLLSVPGRSIRDCVLARVPFPAWAVHRLDQDTSGVLAIAKDLDTYRDLSQQFEHRQVKKIYEAVLSNPVLQSEGMIELPLWSDPCDRPKQKVDLRGKISITQFKRIAPNRVEFIPLTGRTHQLRVHAAEGLGVPILGDRLYGKGEAGRLHLHARELQLKHPRSQQDLQFRADVPF